MNVNTITKQRINVAIIMAVGKMKRYHNDIELEKDEYNFKTNFSIRFMGKRINIYILHESLHVEIRSDYSGLIYNDVPTDLGDMKSAIETEIMRIFVDLA